MNFWSIELVPSERWSQPAGRTEMLMEGGGGGLWYSGRYLRYLRYSILQYSPDGGRERGPFGTVADIQDIQY